MRIAYVSTLYRGGGAERCARELFETARAAGHAVRMYVSKRRGEEPDGVIGVRGAWEKYLKILNKAGMLAEWRHRGSATALARIRPDNCDVAHFHNLHGGWMSISAAAALARRVPTVWTLHDEWAVTGGLAYDLSRVLDQERIGRWFDGQLLLSSREPKARRWQRYLHSRLPRPQVIISPSAYLADLARDCESLRGIPVRRVPYGVKLMNCPDASAERGACRAELGLAPDARVVLLIAADLASPYKGMRLAIEALGRMKDRGVTVLVVGGGAGSAFRDLPVRVVETGFLSDERKLARAYCAADVLLLPSIADNFPYVAMESLSCGTPLVSFRVGGLPEIIGADERGLLAEPFDTTQVAAQLIRILEDSVMRDRLGEAGQRWVRRNCDPAAAIKANVGSYAEAMEAWARDRKNSAPFV